MEEIHLVLLRFIASCSQATFLFVNCGNSEQSSRMCLNILKQDYLDTLGTLKGWRNCTFYLNNDDDSTLLNPVLVL